MPIVDAANIKEALANATLGPGGTFLDSNGEVIQNESGLAVTGSGKGNGKDLNFRPQDVALTGIGNVNSTRNAKGNFSLDVNEDAGTTATRNLLRGGTDRAFSTADALRGGVQDVGAQALDSASDAFGAFGSFNPLAAAQERFDKLDAILTPGRERTRSGIESRLFAQGRLDSTAGSRELADLEEGFQRERAGMLDSQFGEAQGAQANLAQIAQGLTNSGAGIQGGIFNQGVTGIQGGNALSEPMLRLLGLSSELGQATANTKLQKQQIKAAEGGGGGFLDGVGGQILGGLATGAATAFGGPLGGLAANAAVGSFTGGGGGAPASVGTPGGNGMSALNFSFPS